MRFSVAMRPYSGLETEEIDFYFFPKNVAQNVEKRNSSFLLPAGSFCSINRDDVKPLQVSLIYYQTNEKNCETIQVVDCRKPFWVY